MNIVLINFTGGIPLGLAYLAASVRNGNDGEHNVSIFDCDEKDDSKKIIDLIKSMKPKVIGATVYTYHVNDVIRFFQNVKKAMPNVVAVVGGPHPTALPDSMLKSDNIDIVVRGEGEITFRELIHRIDENKPYYDIDGLSFFANGNVTSNRPRKLVSLLDNIPSPAWDLLPISRYKHQTQGPSRMNKGAFINMLTSRGCPYSCVFCGAADVWGRKVRLHSPARIIAEIQELYERYGVHSIRFSDSTFTIDREWVLDFCGMLSSQNIDVAWTANARADRIDKEMALAMKNAGCKCVKIGVESGDETILKKARKGQGLEQIREAFALLRECGIFSWAFFIIGLPGETKETIKKTISFAKEIDPDQVSVCGYAIPYPGTELYDIASKEIAMDFPWSDYHHSRKILYIPSGLTKEDIEEGKRLFCEQLRPGERQIGRMLTE